MADTFSSLNVHFVFGTKNRQPLLVGEIKERFGPSRVGSRSKMK
jgi:REP element-mobilizing transposase RayT